jgi:hypothetical protein
MQKPATHNDCDDASAMHVSMSGHTRHLKLVTSRSAGFACLTPFRRVLETDDVLGGDDLAFDPVSDSDSDSDGTPTTTPWGRLDDHVKRRILSYLVMYAIRGRDMELALAVASSTRHTLYRTYCAFVHPVTFSNVVGHKAMSITYRHLARTFALMSDILEVVDTRMEAIHSIEAAPKRLAFLEFSTQPRRFLYPFKLTALTRLQVIEEHDCRVHRYSEREEKAEMVQMVVGRVGDRVIDQMGVEGRMCQEAIHVTQMHFPMLVVRVADTRGRTLRFVDATTEVMWRRFAYLMGLAMKGCELLTLLTWEEMAFENIEVDDDDMVDNMYLKHIAPACTDFIQ